MSSSMMASSDDPPVDLEKGVVTAAATKDVNPRVAMCVMVFLDAVAVLEVLIFIGLIAWRISGPIASFRRPVANLATNTLDQTQDKLCHGQGQACTKPRRQ
ncbi:unnamed protein product [Urochloa humidicola]